jgi:hypothetical protein
MRSSNFGYVLLLGVVFATPACTVETKITGGSAGSAGSGAGTGGDAGTSGAGKSGSAGQGGSGGGAGSAETGGTAGAAEAGAAGATDTGGAAGSAEAGGAAGAGGSSASSTCDTTSFEFPKITCDSGSVSEFTNPTCQDLFLCMGIADCASSHLDCAGCLDYLKVAFASTDSCIKSATQASLADACNMIAAENATQYPMCAPK